MASALSNLMAVLSLDSQQFIDGLSKSKKKSDSFLATFSNVGGAVVYGALTAIGAGVAAVGTAAFTAAETVDEAFDTIAIATGAQGEELDQLHNDWKVVFSSVPTDASLAADAIGILNTRLGLSGKELQDLTIPLLEAARLLGGDVTQYAENFTRVIGDWNIPVENAAGSLDKLFVAGQKTGIPLETLMQRIVQYGAPMRNFGFSFEEATALLSSFEAQGVNTEIVMSGLRIAQGKFIKENKDMSTGLWETIEAIQSAETGTEALSIATGVFGAKAAGDLTDVIRAGKFDLDALVESMLDADGAILNAADATSDWGEKWTVFKNKMTVALASIGDKLMEGASKAMDKAVEIFERPDVQAALTAFSDFAVNAIGKVVDFLPVLINGFFQFITFLQNNQGIVIAIFAALGVAVVAWGVVTAAAAWAAIVPFLPVIAVILLVAAAAYLLYQAWTNNWGGIQQKTAAAWDFIKTAFQAGKEFIQNLWSGFLNFLDALNSGKLGWISQVWQNIWNGISIIFNTVVDNIKSIFKLFSLAFQGDWRGFGEELRAIWDRSWKAIGQVLSLAWDNLKLIAGNLIKNIISFFRDTDWQELGRMIATGIVNGLQAMGQWALDQIVNFGQAIADALSGFFQIGSPSKLMEKEIGEPLAMGVVVGWENVLDASPFESVLAGALETPIYSHETRMDATAPVAVETGGQGGVTVQFTYAPAVSLGDRYEAEQVLAPMIAEAVRRRLEQES